MANTIQLKEETKKALTFSQSKVFSSDSKGTKMVTTSIELTKEERKFLEELVAKGKYSSISEAVRAGIQELMQEEQLEGSWTTREEVRKYFGKKEKKVRGLEDLHHEET